MSNAAENSNFWEESGSTEVKQQIQQVDIKEKYAELEEEAKTIRKRFKLNPGEYGNEEGLIESENQVVTAGPTEKFYMTNFGSVRLDDMNTPEEKIKGGHDVTAVNEASIASILKGDVSFTPASKADLPGHSSEETSEFEVEKEEEVLEPAGQENYVEEFFFKPIEPDLDKLSSNTKNSSFDAPSDLNAVDRLYFTSSQRTNESGKPESKPLERSSLKDLNPIDEYYFGSSANNFESVADASSAAFAAAGLQQAALSQQKREAAKLPIKAVPDSKKVEKLHVAEQPSTSVGTATPKTLPNGSSSPDTPKTAYDYVRMYRTAQRVSDKKVDMKEVLENSDEVKKLMDISKSGLNENGEREFLKLWQDLRDKPKEIVLSVLKENVIHKGDDFIVLNKPYGMAVHGTPGDDSDLSLVKYLDELAHMLKIKELYTVHRLDRNTTGGLVLAKTQAGAKRYHDMLEEGAIVKRYFAITKGVPEIERGCIKIPLRECIVDGRERMGVQYIAPGDKPKIKVFDAITHYKMISKTKKNTAAFLLVKPETGYKHQIRVHLGLGIGCPVLGDHKYSHADSLRPQRLTEDLLQSLKIRQAKVREMPMFLHACYLNFPLMGPNGRDLIVRIPPPPLFKKVIRWLGMSLK